MDFVKYLKNVSAQKQINKLSKKYKDKKIVLYGAGLYAQILLKNFDTTKLNIVAVCDKKYNDNSEELFCGFRTISPKELTELNCDVVLVTVIEDIAIIDYLQDELLVATKNEDLLVKPFISPTFLYCLKTLIFG